MTSIGNSEFPEMTVSEALEVIEGIKREKAQTTAALGQLLGLKSVTTGYFYNKTAALSKFYGLIERQKTSITLTPLAKRIVYSVSDEDRDKAVREVATRVPLLSSLYLDLGSEFHALDFPEKLLKLTGAKHEEIKSKAPQVEALYRDALKYLQKPSTVALSLPTSATHTDVTRDSGGKPRAEWAAPAPPFRDAWVSKLKGAVRTLDGDSEYYVQVALRVEAIEEAIAVLMALRNRVAHLPPGTGSTAEGTPPSQAKP